MSQNLSKPREKLTPSEYDWAFDAFAAAAQNPWSHFEKQDMPADKEAWQKLPEIDQSAIAGILQGFTQLETIIGDYWSSFPSYFPKPEIVAMSRAFSYQEAIHAYAYNHLESCLGLNTYETFCTDVYAQDKLDLFRSNLVHKFNLSNLAKDICLFSGAGEGVALFASFALLLSYDNLGIGFLDLPQILSWSVRDERLHSDSGIKLYHTLIEEGADKPDEDSVLSYFAWAVNAELKFIGQAFPSNGKLSAITYAQIEAFVQHRANNRLNALRFRQLYEPSAQLVDGIAEWFYPKTGGTTVHDFFVRKFNGSAYSSTGGAGIENVDLGALF